MHAILVLQKPTVLPQRAQSQGGEEATRGREGGFSPGGGLCGLSGCCRISPSPSPLCFGEFSGFSGSQESSDLLRAMASSRSSCSCWVSLASRSFSSRSLSRFAHSIMSSSVGYCSNTQTHTSHVSGARRGTKHSFRSS